MIKGRPHESDLDLTVAMSTFNRKDWALEALKSLEHVTIPDLLDWEVLVVDNNCSDGTWDALHEYKLHKPLPIRIVKEEKIGLSRARNRIICEARGEIISLFDDDERFDLNYLVALVKAFSNPKVDMVCGRISLDYETGRPSWIKDEWEGFLSRVDAGDFGFRINDEKFVFSGGNLAFVKRRVEEWEYFDVNLSRQGKIVIGGGDVKFCKSAFHAGAHIRYEPKVLLYHKIPSHRSTKQHLRQLRFRAGEGLGRIDERMFEKQICGIPFFAFSLLCKMIVKYLHLALMSDDIAFRQQLNVVHQLGWLSGLWRKWRGDLLVPKP